ncbi:SDR family NAD(P)-dependent oxidoreductase [Halieaceae bacterium IMCC14734]|uniref:SDR family NAD(P)-dependent oxidoreductase n=1 Tax=Candidatus Litorirhabdus singularis TaxID=2518993 RepID=A0ABT3TCV5_9GAMM|nr:SDR family NAD(P)-dependent oxidoreductase [Candidatus Litorirhabdus singularis]MCX2980128.1 SDR family NAD(P)-dependent oxidoreductase [Candidatus Litorirhabdus singularis]
MPASDNTHKATALIIGAGPGTGGAIAQTFATAGYRVCVARRDKQQLQELVASIRSHGGEAHAYGLDACDEDAVIQCFADIERDLGPLEVVVYNAAIGARRPITELSAGTFRRVWETDCFGAFLVGREAARCMLPRANGSIFFTGATAALRGGAQFAAFAAAKHGARALAQSMARELGPQGIHVAHIIVDGPIDGEFVRTTFPDMVADRPDDGLLDPAAIASSYLMLHNQPRNAWTHELDLRPWVEPW